MSKILDSLQAILLNNTVLSDWFSPMQKALDEARYSRQQFSVLSAEFFILLGWLRQLEGTKILWEQIQSLFDLDEKAETVPLARSTWSDALCASSTRNKILREAVQELVRQLAINNPPIKFLVAEYSYNIF
jgi:hypothetical protein